MYLLYTFTELKDLFGAWLRLEPDALHVHVGIAVFFAVALLVRGRRPFVTAYWVVLAIAVAGEVFDLLYDYELGHQLRWLNSVKDIGNAMVWPTAWMLVGRHIAGLIWQTGQVRVPAARRSRRHRSRIRPTPLTTGLGPPVSTSRESAPSPELGGVGK